VLDNGKLGYLIRSINII